MQTVSEFTILQDNNTVATMDHVVSFEDDIVQEGQDRAQSSETESEINFCRKNILLCKLLCVVLAIVVSIGWMCIIVLLILKEEWQLVLVAWLLLYAAGHFCYWYFRRRSTRTLTAQIRQQLVTRMGGTEVVESCDGDKPPSYDELVKCEIPPPTYCSVVHETPKLKRILKIHSLSLPWFITKKNLEQSGNGVVTLVENKDMEVEAPSSSNGSHQSDGWKSSVTAASVPSPLCSDDVEEPIELPSYDVLMRDAVQPILTPIHQALAKLPSLPPPYSVRPMQSIAEDEQQQEQALE